MTHLWENNLLLFAITYALAIGAWLGCRKISNIRLRRAIKASIVFLAIPIIVPTHPVHFYLSWMMVAATLSSPDEVWTTIVLGVWCVFIGIAQIGVKKAG